MQKEFPGESISDRVIEAAVEQLHDNRLEGLDIEDVSRRAGLDAATVRAIYPDEQALDEALGNFGIARLSASMNSELVAAPPNDPRAALIALGCGYLRWARESPRLYQVITTQLMQPRRTNSIVRIYDASFVPLVHRFLGETDDRITRRAAIARAFLYGLTDLALDDHLDLWLPPGSADVDAELAATIADFVDLLLAAPAPPGAPVQPIRSEA